jgi:hypothetical protein
MAMSIMMAAALTAQASARPAGPLGWMTGEWSCRDATLAAGPVYRSETWRGDGSGGLIGEIRTTQLRGGAPDRRTIATVRVTGRVNRIRMSYAPENGPPIIFRLVRQSSHEAVFESAGARQPQRIVYRRGMYSRPGAVPSLGPRDLAVTQAQLDGSQERTWRMSDVRMHVGRFCRSGG